MTKPIYPTQEWLDQWVDRWLEEHPTEKVEDFKALEAQAMDAWWLNEIEHDRATPFDLSPEQEAESKKARKGMARAVNAYGKEVKRERKPDEVKREVIATVAKNLTRCWLDDGETNVLDITIANPEREVTFTIGGVTYSLTLTKHRPPKG